jgi:hypothetical protein
MWWSGIDMMAIRGAAEVVILAVAVSFAGRAGAAESVSRPRAEQLFYEGKQALDRHDYEKACADFQQSLALAPRGSVFRNLANAEWALGRTVEALAHLRAALAQGDLPAENRGRAERDLATFYAATGHLAVETDPGAIVLVDGVKAEGVASGSAPIDVKTGVRALEARLGNLSAHTEVDAKAGEVLRVDLFVDRPKPLAVRAGRLSAAPMASPPAHVSTERVPSMPEGRSGDGAKGRRMLGMAIGGAGFASLATGAVFFVLATHAEHSAASAAAGLGTSSCAGASPAAGCAALTDARSSERTDGAASRVLIGAGAAALVAGAVLALWPSQPTGPVAMVPWVGPTDARLGVEGSF